VWGNVKIHHLQYESWLQIFNFHSSESIFFIQKNVVCSSFFNLKKNFINENNELIFLKFEIQLKFLKNSFLSSVLCVVFSSQWEEFPEILRALFYVVSIFIQILIWIWMNFLISLFLIEKNNYNNNKLLPSSITLQHF
jgi:hypothetical protein